MARLKLLAWHQVLYSRKYSSRACSCQTQPSSEDTTGLPHFTFRWGLGGDTDHRVKQEGQERRRSGIVELRREGKDWSNGAGLSCQVGLRGWAAGANGPRSDWALCWVGRSSTRGRPGGGSHPPWQCIPAALPLLASCPCIAWEAAGLWTLSPIWETWLEFPSSWLWSDSPGYG